MEVICGPMFSGKTEELIRRVKRARLAKLAVAIYKPAVDTRVNDRIYSRAGLELKARVLSSAAQIAEDFAVNPVDVIAIDEAQFFDGQIVDVCNDLAAKARIVVAGLDLDFRAEPFGPMPALLALAEDVDKLTGVCFSCHREKATRTQRLINGSPAPYDSPTILIGDSESYECRCRKCYELKPSSSLARVSSL